MNSRIDVFKESSNSVVGACGSIIGNRSHRKSSGNERARLLPEQSGKCVISVVDTNLPTFSLKNSSMVLDIENEDELQKFYQAITKDGKVKFELQETSLGIYQAIFSDCFGVTWTLNYSAY